MLQLDNYELLTPIYLLLTFLAFLFFSVPLFHVFPSTLKLCMKITTDHLKMLADI